MNDAANNQAAEANEAYGRVREGVFLGTFALERAFPAITRLLRAGDWQLCGPGFDDVETFLNSLGLDKFKRSAVERKDLVEAAKAAQANVSNRAIARAIGVAHTTIDRDTGTNEPDGEKIVNGNNGRQNQPGTVVPGFTGARAGSLIDRRENPTDWNERHQRVADKIGDAQLAPSLRGFPVLLADPPWRYENAPMGGGNRSIENHYPTLDLGEICALFDPDDFADDAILYLWATAPKLFEAFDVVTAWGFDYRTNLVWIKDRIGMGYYARSQHELLLVCKRGEMPTPAPEARISSVIDAPRGEHSEKPAAVYELIEASYPTLRKIELFSRKPRDGWAAWGNEAQAA